MVETKDGGKRLTDYYDIRDLTIEGVPVYLRIGGEDAMGHAKFTPAGWVRWRLGTPRESVDLPRNVPVDAWRPIKEDMWPEPLPEPMTLRGPPDFRSPPEPETVRHGNEGEDWWVNPKVRLGTAGEAPETALECEIRILRCLCTKEVLEYEPNPKPCLWPRNLMIEAGALRKMLASGYRPRGFRDEDASMFHIDKSELEVRIARWMPSHRDVSDAEGWGQGTGPRYWAKPNDMHLFVLRADRYSTAAIARSMNVPEVEIVKAFSEARLEAFRRSTRSTDVG